jgi:hypothetical protein
VRNNILPPDDPLSFCDGSRRQSELAGDVTSRNDVHDLGMAGRRGQLPEREGWSGGGEEAARRKYDGRHCARRHPDEFSSAWPHVDLPT